MKGVLNFCLHFKFCFGIIVLLEGGVMMYKIGDKIIYGQTGVCEIVDICEKVFIRNQKRLYYVLKPFNIDNNLIYAPVENNKVFMRHLITKSQAEELIDSIPNIVEKISMDDEINKDIYMQMIENHSLISLIELTAIIYTKKINAQKIKKHLNIVDEKYMKIAENLLFGELSAVLEIPFESVTDYIFKRTASIV